MKSIVAACLVCLSMAGAARAQDAGGMVAGVLVIESLPHFEQWLVNQRGEAPYPGRLREVAAGKAVHFPIVVTRLRPPAQGVMKLVADIEFFAPDGKSLWVARGCCAFTIQDRPDVRTAVLGPTANLRLDPKDMPGVYTVRVSVTDGLRTAVASESFRFVAPAAHAPATPKTDIPPRPSGAPKPAALPKAESPAPRLRMNTPPAAPGKDQDKRDCLALPTPAEVIKCAERK
jgi:hypothetical protein